MLQTRPILDPLPNLSAASPAKLGNRFVTIVVLTFATLFIHGYHPFVEDGGIYAAGVILRLNPSLFPHDAAFVNAHNTYSVFDPLLAGMVRVLHLPVEWVLLLCHLGCIWLTLFAVWRISGQSFRSQSASLFATLTFAASFTLPVAGTSLYLMEPYLTARSFSTPLSLLALSFALAVREAPDFNLRRKEALLAIICLLVTAVIHLLMAAYALAFLACYFLLTHREEKRQWIAGAAAGVGGFLLAGMVYVTATPETPAVLAADASRTYWFLANWQWFEWIGLVLPLVIFALFMPTCSALNETGRLLCRTSLVLGCCAIFIALIFGHADSPIRVLARLQPLRIFVMLYAVMVTLLGGAMGNFVASDERVFARKTVAATLGLVAVAAAMFYAQLRIVPASPHLELPGRVTGNPWVQAFLWMRFNTPADALVALDANYITTPGEDAQVFRAIAQRSALCDFSKDGGVASIRPVLADNWLAQSSAQRNLSTLADTDRDARLLPLRATWMVLRSTAHTGHPCPYANNFVKVCALH